MRLAALFAEKLASPVVSIRNSAACRRLRPFLERPNETAASRLSIVGYHSEKQASPQIERQAANTNTLETPTKSIWIDLDNSPHVPLFVPIIRHYRDTGINVVLTAREHSQTIELLKLHGLDGTFTVIGRHHGKGKLSKILGTLDRARQLAAYITTGGSKVSVAVSHGSRSLVLAARWLKIPVLTMYDYEFTETRIFNTFSDRVLVPDRIPDIVLDKIGLAKDKRIKYPGIKEELYVRDFQADTKFKHEFLSRHDCNPASTFVVLRPPAATANYHSSKSDEIFGGLLKHVLRSDGLFTAIVPRTSEQADEIEAAIERMALSNGSFTILREAVDGLQLAFAADLLISGGGTMNREAALLGVPVYSIFAGRPGSLDAQMEEEGLITFIRQVEEISKIDLQRCRTTVKNLPVLTDRVEKFVIDEIEKFL